MSIFKTLTCNIGSYYYFLREIISPSLIRDAKEIPIIINNFNRLTTLRLLTETLTACGYTNIYILEMHRLIHLCWNITKPAHLQYSISIKT